MRNLKKYSLRNQIPEVPVEGISEEISSKGAPREILKRIPGGNLEGTP